MLKKILVTGGAGFIGSHLCEELVKDDSNHVFSIDNYSTGKEDNHVEGVKYIRGETKDIASLIGFAPDVIYHLGEYSRVEQSFDDVKKVWEYNKVGTFSVLEFCRKYTCKIIYAGSSTKFGDGGLGRFQSPYGWSKATNTELVQNYGSWFGVPYAIAYFYNAYGKREIRSGKYATLIGIFSEKMKKSQPLTVVSPGDQTRNFTHIDDIVSGLILVGEQGAGDGFGIGSPIFYSVMEVAKMFGGEIQMLPHRQGNRMVADLMTDKTKALGWIPKGSLDNYIEMLKKNDWNRELDKK